MVSRGDTWFKRLSHLFRLCLVDPALDNVYRYLSSLLWLCPPGLIVLADIGSKNSLAPALLLFLSFELYTQLSGHIDDECLLDGSRISDPATRYECRGSESVGAESTGTGSMSDCRLGSGSSGSAGRMLTIAGCTSWRWYPR